jgi:hypothetical protein
MERQFTQEELKKIHEIVNQIKGLRLKTKKIEHEFKVLSQDLEDITDSLELLNSIE